MLRVGDEWEKIGSELNATLLSKLVADAFNNGVLTAPSFLRTDFLNGFPRCGTDGRLASHDELSHLGEIVGIVVDTAPFCAAASAPFANGVA
jgi:hypothetical protein